MDHLNQKSNMYKHNLVGTSWYQEPRIVLNKKLVRIKLGLILLQFGFKQ